MYTVKRFTKGQEIYRLGLENDGQLVWIAPATRFVVMTPEGQPKISVNSFTKKLDIEMFSRKYTAEAQADYLNS